MFLPAFLLLVLVLMYTPQSNAGSLLDRRGINNEKRRTVMAWANGHPSVVSQLQNASWSSVFDGVQAFCGVNFRSDGYDLQVNMTKWQECSALCETTKNLGIKFHVVIEGKVPDEAKDNLHRLIDGAVSFARMWGIDGFSLDDEYDCAPRSTLDRLERWMTYVNAFAQGLHNAGLELSAAVQAMFGIQDVPYNPYCKHNASAAECSQACRDPPSKYALEPRVTQLLSESVVDRWLEMDTYYFSTGRFLNTLDWYAKNVPQSKLGVSMMNRDDLSDDGLLARFHAIDKSGVDWINIFMLPADDMFLPFLKRWKSYCAGCGVQSELGCYDLTVPCLNQQAAEVS